MEENDSNMSVFDERDNGEIKSVNIFAVTFHPSAMLGILKIIHAKFTNLKSASNLNGNLNCSKELEHYAS